MPLPFSPLLRQRNPSCPSNPVTTLLHPSFLTQDVQAFSTPSLDLVPATEVLTQWGFVSRCPCGISQQPYLLLPVGPEMKQGTCRAGGTGRRGRDAKDTELLLFSKKGCIWNVNAGQTHTAPALLGNTNAPPNRLRGENRNPTERRLWGSHCFRGMVADTVSPIKLGGFSSFCLFAALLY